MRADQLRSAAETIAELLKKSDVLNSIRQHRDAREDRQRQSTRARLNQSAKILLAGSRAFAEPENNVCTLLHLDKIASLDYWQALLNADGDQRAQEAELVQLYSRVMFASSHLPSLLGMVSEDSSAPAVIERAPGENTLTLRLNDAGESAADPDRIARAIDGIDMVYAASVSLSRRPAMDLQLRQISGHPEKLLVFLGDEEGMSALCTVLESIPAVLDQFRDEEHLDLVEVVNSLPIFHDLATLADAGNFTDVELRDIDDTMHQGIMLALESGVVVHDMPQPLDPENGVTTLNKRAPQDYADSHEGQQRFTQAPTRGFAQEAEQRYGSQQGDQQYDDHYNAHAADDVEGNESMHADREGYERHPAAMQAEPDHLSANYQDVAHQNNAQDSLEGRGVDDSDEYYQQYLSERQRLREGTRGGRKRGGKEPQIKKSLSSLFKGLSKPENK